VEQGGSAALEDNVLRPPLRVRHPLLFFQVAAHAEHPLAGAREHLRPQRRIGLQVGVAGE
jgi:hypothetical protein